ncbi:MAG TPA: D-aminoacylase [Blastocatellia bacterium]|nr:D-aminoacylase [Blastocatellia bacterium]
MLKRTFCLVLLAALVSLGTYASSVPGFRILLASHSRPPAFATTQQKAPSRVILGATVVDGSGRRGFAANVRIVGDRIAKVGSFAPGADDEVIQARGMVVAPGFIDIHNHSEQGLAREPAAPTQVSQGITTIAVGPDGGSPWPIAEYLQKLENNRTAVNVVTFIGHATVREQVMGKDYARAATDDEIAKMTALVDRAMREGAFGLSSGLEYDVGRSSTTEELIELARAASRYGGIYMTHMRDEEEGMLDALREAIRIGRQARLPVQISHIKMGNRNVWGQAAKAIAMINRARRAGRDVTADCYPYTAWASTITILVPSRKHDDDQAVATALGNVGGAKNVLITGCKAHPNFEGKTLEEIALANNGTPIAAYQQIVRDGGASIVCNSMNERDVRAFYRQRWVMVSSDGGIGSRHPRGAGTFTRVLGRFVREQSWLSLEEAIRKMTSAPAKRLGLADRGMIGEGMKADLVIFDPKRVIDRSTFKEPLQLSEGMEQVFVNGEAVWENGKPTGRLPGAVLRKKN